MIGVTTKVATGVEVSLSAVTGSAVLRADAAQSALCAYLSLIALVGLAVNAIWHMAWADPCAALLIIPLVLREGWQAPEADLAVAAEKVTHNKSISALRWLALSLFR